MLRKSEIFVICILIITAVVRFYFFRPAPPKYEGAVGKLVQIEGIVSDNPDVRLKNQRLTITPTGQESNIIAVVSLSENVSYGDKVQVKGTLLTPANFITTAGKEFNYVQYLNNKDIYYIINDTSLTTLSHNNGSSLMRFLFHIKNSFMKKVSESIPSPESDLANGLILGARGGFDTDAKNEFISTGTIHIIALSGYNVTIVAQSVMGILELFLSAVVSLWIGIILILLFVLMSGAGATAIRAGIMATIALLAKLTGRTYDAGRALVIAGLLMVAYDPRVLADISFHLSFLATVGILFMTPKVLHWVKWLPTKFQFRDTVATTIAATITVLPILVYSTGILSLVSLPANALILPLIPYAMLFSFLTGLIGLAGHILTVPVGFASYLLLTYILRVIHFFASLPFASVIVSSFPLWMTILIYIFLGWWMFHKSKAG